MIITAEEGNEPREPWRAAPLVSDVLWYSSGEADVDPALEPSLSPPSVPPSSACSMHWLAGCDSARLEDSSDSESQSSLSSSLSSLSSSSTSNQSDAAWAWSAEGSSSCSTLGSSTSNGSQPSKQFPSMGIEVKFTSWSPSEDDDIILGRSSPLSLLEWESDLLDWGEFREWSPVPSLEEAEILHQELKKQEDEMHERARKKREAKKAKYFEQRRMRRKIKDICYIYSA